MENTTLLHPAAATQDASHKNPEPSLSRILRYAFVKHKGSPLPLRKIKPQNGCLPLYSLYQALNLLKFFEPDPVHYEETGQIEHFFLPEQREATWESRFPESSENPP